MLKSWILNDLIYTFSTKNSMSNQQQQLKIIIIIIKDFIENTTIIYHMPKVLGLGGMQILKYLIFRILAGIFRYSRSLIIGTLRTVILAIPGLIKNFKFLDYRDILLIIPDNRLVIFF